MFEALIFDMDGLMIDSERLYWAVEKGIARQFGKDVSQETLWKMMGRRPIEGMRIFVQDLELPMTAERALEMRDELMLDKYRDESDPMPGLIHILQAFHRRLKLAVCTGAQRKFMEIVVDRLKIRDRFDVLQASDEIRKGKPHPEIYRVTCEKLGVAPRQAIVLEDSSNGSIAANRAGCYTIAVPSEYSRGQDFSCADFIAADLFEAERHISALLS